MHIPLLVIVVATLLGPVAQQPAPRDSRQPATGTGRISGVVLTDEEQPKPLRRARVTISGDVGTPGATATDEQGRFSFEGLPTGRFTLTAGKDGYVSMAHMARRPGRPGTSIALLPDQHVDNLTFKLPRGAVITGVVTDHNGDVAPSTAVRAMRYVSSAGQRRLMTAVASTTNERGVYRLFGLAADEYVVVASPQIPGLGQSVAMRLTSDADVSQAIRELSSPAAAGAAPSARRSEEDEGRSVMWAPVYYPSTVSVAEGAVVPVRAGEERNGVDIQLQLVPTGRIDGTLLAVAGGSPVPPASVMLVTVGQQELGMSMESIRTVRSGDTGAFSFESVPAGQYTVVARATPPRTPDAAAGARAPDSTLWASTAIGVSGSGTSRVTLQLSEGLSVSGRVQLEPGAPGDPLPDIKTIYVGLEAVQTGNEINLMTTPAQVVDASGAFTIAGVVPGRYRISALARNSRDWTVKSGVLAGRNVVDQPFEVRGGNVSAIELTLSNRSPQISGAAQDANGRPALDYFIIVFPADPSYRTPRRIQAVRPSSDGKYVVRVPAGEYLLAAVTDVEPNEWRDLAFLERLAPNALRLTLADGEEKVQDLRLGGS